MLAMKSLLTVFQAVALAIFAYQMYGALHKYIEFNSYPSVETRDIVDTGMPDLFICLQEDHQYAYQRAIDVHGYFYSTFLEGFVNRSTGFVSWEGVQNLTYNEVLKELFIPILGDLELAGDLDEERATGDELPEIFTAFNGRCRKIITKNIEPSQVFKVDLMYGWPFDVFVADPGRSLHYMIHPDSLLGEKIETWNQAQKYYSLEIEKHIWDEDSGECMSYGAGKPFKSYADCIAKEQEKVFMPLLGCMVPWLAGPEHPNICKGRVLLAMEHLPHYRQAIDDIYRTRAFRIMEESKACPQPCSQLQARAALKSVRYGTLEVAIASAMEISLHIKKTVKVTRYMKAYGIFDLVVEVGSSLGLWIGLSALGLLQLLIDTMTNAKTKLFN